MLKLLFVLVACQKPAEPQPGDGDPTTETDTDTTPTVDTTVTAHTADTAPIIDTYVTPTTDCALLTPGPIAVTGLVEPRGHHGLAFDIEDHIVGSDGSNLIKWLSTGEVTPWGLGTGGSEQMDYLADGDLAVAVFNSGAIVRVSPLGVVSPITSDVNAYGLVRGPDDMIWAGNNNDLYRIDPATGEKPILIQGNASLKPRVIDFSPDATKVYIGSFTNGDMFVADLDANFDPIGNPYLFASNVGSGPYMDCLTVDECGNVYACDYTQRKLYRISPTGQVGTFVDWNPISLYGHGVAWGSGLGGWSATAMYLPQPYNSDKVVEVEVGVRSGELLWP